MTQQLLLLIGVFLGSIAIGFPVVLGLALATVIYALIFPVMHPVVLIQTLVSGLNNPMLTAIPFYLLLGAVMNTGGISQRLLRLAAALMGWCRGGMAHVNIGASVFFGGVSGSAVADASAVGSIMIPAMKKDGYTGAYAAAVTATSATVGSLIPPSIPLVLFGVFNDASVGELFLAGAIPGLLMGGCLLITSALLARQRHYPAGGWVGWQELAAAFRGCVLALLLPLLVVYCLVAGIATVTEIGAIAVLFAVCLSTCVYRTCGIADISRAFADAAVQSARILCIIAVSGGSLWIVANMGIFEQLQSSLSQLSLTPEQLLLAIAAGLVILGTVVGPVLQMVLIIPQLAPVAVHNDIDILQFAIVSIVASSTGLITPPVGILLFLTSSQAGSTVAAVVVESLPFLASLLLLIGCLIYFPALSTWLPDLLR